MTEPTDAELDELRQANSGRLNFVTFSEFRTIARAVLAKWGSQPLRYDQSPTLFTVFAKCDEYEGEVPLAQYSATSEYGVLDRVMGDARNAGYTGHAKDRMTELGWRIVPVYAKPQPAPPTPQADSQPALDEAVAMSRTRDLAEAGRWPSDWVEAYRRGYSDRASSAPADSVLEDAARYRLVRRGQHWSVINGIGDALRGEELDAAVDAARKQGGA